MARFDSTSTKLHVSKLLRNNLGIGLRLCAIFWLWLFSRKAMPMRLVTAAIEKSEDPSLMIYFGHGSGPLTPFSWSCPGLL